MGVHHGIVSHSVDGYEIKGLSRHFDDIMYSINKFRSFVLPVKVLLS